MRGLSKYFWIMGILTVVVLVVPEVGTVAAFTIIGLPLAAIYWAIPPVFIISVIGYLLYSVLPLRGKIGGIVSLVLAAGLLAIPPYILNGPIRQNAQARTTGDIDNLKLPLKARVIASRKPIYYRGKETRCDGFCLHALLTGTAERFLVVDAKKLEDALSPDEEAIQFRLERRTVCPEVNLKPGRHKLKFKNARRSNASNADPLVAMKLRISNGECLVSEPAKLADADLVISQGPLATNVSRRNHLGFEFTTDSAKANRISVHRRDNDGRFVELYRRTQVRYQPFGQLLLPAPDIDSGFKTSMGWWRTGARINMRRRYPSEFAETELLEKKLGFNLRLEDKTARTEILAKLEKLLDQGDAPNREEWAVFSQFFDGIGLGHIGRMRADDFKLGLRVLESENFPAIPRLSTFVRYAKRNGTQADLDRLARIFASRLNSGSAQFEAIGEKPAEQTRRLAIGLKALPDDALLPLRDVLMPLAFRSDFQQHGYVALKRWAVYGPEAVPTLLALMKTGYEGGEHFYRNRKFQHPYLGGIQGLCAGGASTASALKELHTLIQEEKLPVHGPYGRLLFTTLIRLGADKEEVRTLFKTSARNKSHATDDHFERLVVRATGKHDPCYY